MREDKKETIKHTFQKKTSFFDKTKKKRWTKQNEKGWGQ
jgi:hypothetical protein